MLEKYSKFFYLENDEMELFLEESKIYEKS